MSTNSTTLSIDVNAIPEYKRDYIAKATLDAVKRFLAQPGGREFLDAKKEELREQGKLPPKPNGGADGNDKC